MACAQEETGTYIIIYGITQFNGLVSMSLLLLSGRASGLVVERS